MRTASLGPARLRPYLAFLSWEWDLFRREKKEKKKTVVLTLQEDLKRANVTRSRGFGKSMYGVTSWMGD